MGRITGKAEPLKDSRTDLLSLFMSRAKESGDAELLTPQIANSGIPFWKTLLSDWPVDESSPSWIETGRSERSVLKTEFCFGPHTG